MRKRSEHTVRAIVVGAGINGLGVLRSLARAGVPVVVVDKSGDQPAMRSRFGRKIVYREDAASASLLQSLEALADERPAERSVLILTQEETVAIAAEHHAQLSSRFRLTMPGPVETMTLLNKHGVRSIAESIGARIPRTLRVQTPSHIDLVDSLKLPVIVKPALRHAGYANDFNRAYRLDNRSQIRDLLERMLPVLPDVLVQEWIEGTDSDIYFCLQYIPPSGGEPVSFVGRKIRSWPPRVGGTASCAPAPEAQELAAVSTAFFRQAGITGLASLEYKRDSISGEYVIIEPTVGRTDFQEEVATLNGVNLPFMAYMDLLDLPQPRALVPRMTRCWREWMSDIQSAQITPSSETRMPEHARFTNGLWQPDDPMPAMHAQWRRIRRRIVKTIRNRGNIRGNQPG